MVVGHVMDPFFLSETLTVSHLIHILRKTRQFDKQYLIRKKSTYRPFKVVFLQKYVACRRLKKLL